MNARRPPVTGLAFALLGLSACSQQQAQAACPVRACEPASAMSSSSAAPAEGLHSITYQVSSSAPTHNVRDGGIVHVTYSDLSDSTIQQDTISPTIGAPWSKTWEWSGRGTVFLSIQLRDEAVIRNGQGASCTILVDGRAVSTHSATGYNVAECRY